jgi:hypothetical protein
MRSNPNIFINCIRLSLASSLAFLLLATASGCLPTANECASYEEGCGAADQVPLDDPFGAEEMPAFGGLENGYSNDALFEDDDQGDDDQNGPLQCDDYSNCPYEFAVDAGLVR